MRLKPAYLPLLGSKFHRLQMVKYNYLRRLRLSLIKGRYWSQMRIYFGNWFKMGKISNVIILLFEPHFEMANI